MCSDVWSLHPLTQWNVSLSTQAGCSEPSECFQRVFWWKSEAGSSVRWARPELCVHVCVVSPPKKKNGSEFFCCLFLSGVTHQLTQNLFVSPVFLSVCVLVFFSLSITNTVKYLKNSGSFELQKHGFLVEIYIGGCFLLAEHFIFHLTLFQTQTQMVCSRLQVRGQRLRLIYSLWFSVSSGHGHMALCWRGHRYQLTVMYVLCVCVCKSSGSTCVILSSRPVKERIGVYFCEWTSASWCCACEYILNEQCHAC